MVFLTQDLRRSPRVLVVDDDEEVGLLLRRYLAANGFEVALADCAASARSSIRGSAFDVVLLDVGLPDGSGLSLVTELRANWGGPVIIVSGRDEAVERIVGLELGADDFVSKPFDLRELLARIRSVLRRAGVSAGQVTTLLFDGLSLAVEHRSLTGRNGAEIVLTSGEFALLSALLDRPQQVLGRDFLLETLHGRLSGPFDRSIDVQVGRLRRKVERDPAMPRLIRSVRGAGYLLAATVERR